MRDDLRDEKAAWRRLAVAMFRLTPREARRRLDAALTERVRDIVLRRGARRLLGFAPMLDEPDLSVFFRRWIKEGGQLALPVWLGGDRMRIRWVTDVDSQLSPGRGGILEPAAGLPEADGSELDLAVTPGRAFSESRLRLGRGSGCYDELFRRHPGITKVGVAYDFQVFPALPADERDVPVDVVATPSRLVGEV